MNAYLDFSPVFGCAGDDGGGANDGGGEGEAEAQRRAAQAEARVRLLEATLAAVRQAAAEGAEAAEGAVADVEKRWRSVAAKAKVEKEKAELGLNVARAELHKAQQQLAQTKQSFKALNAITNNDVVEADTVIKAALEAHQARALCAPPLCNQPREQEGALCAVC